jgi:hypothetical protein
MDEYVGCKLEQEWEEHSIRFTQPVMIQSFKDEFDVLEGSRFKTPAEPGSVLVKCEEENGLMNTLQTVYRSGTGKLLHMMRWSCPELLNPVRELLKHLKVAATAHLKALKCVMAYVVATPKRGLTLKPVGTWDGLKDYRTWTMRKIRTITGASLEHQYFCAKHQWH